MAWKLFGKKAGNGINLSPEILYEAAPNKDKNRLCLVCGNDTTYSCLLTIGIYKPIVPMCKNCSGEWKFYDYTILKRIKILPLFFKITWHFFKNIRKNWVSFGDYYRFISWGYRMNRLKKIVKKHSGVKKNAKN